MKGPSVARLGCLCQTRIKMDWCRGRGRPTKGGDGKRRGVQPFALLLKGRALVSFLCQSVSLVNILSESFRRGVGCRGVGCMRLRGGLKEVSDQLIHQMWG